jgi:hypothetical protein
MIEIIQAIGSKGNKGTEINLDRQIVIGIADKINSDSEKRSKEFKDKKNSTEEDSIDTQVFNEDNYLVLENINCRDANGTLFEHYDTLYIKKEIERYKTKRAVSKTYPQWNKYFKAKNTIFPSFALTCHILLELYGRIDQPEYEKVLQQYNTHPPSPNCHAQNTVIDWDKGQIIHYPSNYPFKIESQGGLNPFKMESWGGLRTELDFNTKNLGIQKNMQDALQDPDYLKFLRNLTGLEFPRMLTNIADYFKKPLVIWTRREGESWTSIDCVKDYFLLNGNTGIYDINIAREMRVVKK